MELFHIWYLFSGKVSQAADNSSHEDDQKDFNLQHLGQPMARQCRGPQEMSDSGCISSRSEADF